MNRLIKALWFTTLVATFTFLLFVYAGFHEDQLIFLNDTMGGIDREVFFFAALSIVMLSNFTFYILQWRMRKQDTEIVEFVKGWLMGLAASFNFFLIVTLSFLQVFNGGENFDYANIGYLIFLSLGIIVLCVLTLPAYIIKEKILG